ncbi:stage III sporulation protein AA [Cohnella pontilimi]|uniref:Stage III sporulation protein AA n=1 Tax=Cohnella pontilimi TaxID=2564100 RepID=A0A4U0FHN9_9BACL|nr:stage III sporulation protein AA [Cohnella pontilimi]TJY44458.1 stage III sporulation protein AA [Cohnella pontilimi]
MSPALPDLFVQPLRGILERLPSHAADTLEEIRIRENRPLEIGYAGRHGFVDQDGALTADYRKAYMPGREECRALLERVTNHSLYAVEEELRRGYVTVAGGHRIGLAGRAVLERGAVAHLKDIAGFNVRIARARSGCAAAVLPGILDLKAGTVKHTLIVSPPQQGKTTLLRDLVRSISSGDWNHPAAIRWGGRKVGVVDERSEIAACEAGVPTFDLGPRCDVLDACPKAEGIMMMVRSLSPEVVAVDEIGRPEDADALNEALHAGVRVLATAHATSLADVFARPVLARLAEDCVFGAYVIVSRSGGQVRYRIVAAEDAVREVKARSMPAIRSPAAQLEAQGP